jgi:hypothetical protein
LALWIPRALKIFCKFRTYPAKTSNLPICVSINLAKISGLLAVGSICRMVGLAVEQNQVLINSGKSTVERVVALERIQRVVPW